MDMPWRLDPELLKGRLDKWAKQTIGSQTEVTSVEAPKGTGLSSETLLFDVLDQTTTAVSRYAARLAPDPAAYTVFPSYDFASQRRCMQLIAEHTTLPVPEVPWHETDPAWVGAPFLVMRRIDGVAPTDIPGYMTTGWLHDATPDQQAQVERLMVEVQVGVHRLTPASHDLDFLNRPQFGSTPIEQHVNYQEWYYNWAREQWQSELIERTIVWVRANIPAAEETVLNWGDARIGNTLWRDFRPVAVLDWEMAALGPREIDVAWVIWMHEFFQFNVERAGLTGIPGFLQPSTVVRLYEAASGVILNDLHWYTVFAMLRFCIITLRTTGRSIKFGRGAVPENIDEIFRFRHLLEDRISR